MTHAQYTAARATLGWSAPYLARLLGKSVHTVKNYTRDGYHVPLDVAEWLQRRVDAHRAMFIADPPPRRTR